MIASLTNTLWRLSSLSWLTGPIFDKELRVSSRRRRNYLIRSLYVVLLTLFIAFVWAEEVRYGGSSAVYRVSRMARAGRSIIICIVWFQFLAVQIVAGVMLSNAISDEIYNRTLGVLMTTPINSFQIVAGKLCSKLLQTIVLLAITLPLLAVVRVFGGVPWGYLLSSLCVTMTTVIFVGSLSMFFSIFSRRAYVVIIITVLTLGLIYFLAPLMTCLIWNMVTGRWPDSKIMMNIFYTNPYFALATLTERLMSPGFRNAWTSSFAWQIHCAITLAGSLFLLAVSVILVRKVALAQVVGQTFTVLRKRRPRQDTSTAAPVEAAHGAIRTVTGNPVHWKERLLPILGRSRLISRILFAVGILILLLTYMLVAITGANFDHEEVHFIYCFILFGVGALFTLVLPATVITTEKESRAWPLLLQTTLTEGQILTGKFLALFRRCAVFWLPFFAHVLVFTVFGCINPAALPMLILVILGAALFVIGSGIFFSAWFKHTTTAVIANFIFALAIWGGVPLVMALLLFACDGSDDPIENYADIIPVVQLGVVIDACVPSGSHRFYWPGHRQISANASITWIFFCTILYTGLGALLAHLAGKLFRRKIFHNT